MRIRLALLTLAPISAWSQSPSQALQHVDVNAPATIVAPLPAPRSTVRSDNTSKTDKLGRELDAASRNVHSDSIRNEVQRRDALLESDRMRTERLRATTDDPVESERLRHEFDLRRADYERWRTDQLHKREQLETPTQAPPPPDDDH